MEKINWIARYYDDKDNIIHTETFKDRTEHEAENEAMGLMPDDCEDWSLLPDETIQEFLRIIWYEP